jgi:hypothetical protein
MGKQGRDCPALGTTISSARCGAERNFQIRCPASCSFNPFGTEAYDLFLVLEEKFIPKVLGYAIGALGRDEFADVLEDTTPKGTPEEVAAAVGPVQALFMAMAARDPKGRTLWEEWSSQDWAGLNNDERLLAQCHSRSFVTICEIQKIMDDHRILCADLLDAKAERFLIFDRQMAQRARFDRFVGRMYALPNFARPVGMPVSIEHRAVTELIAAIESSLKESPKTNPEMKTVKEWLFYNFPEAIEWLYDYAREQRNAMLSNMDLHHCVATYAIAGSRTEIEAVFRRKPDFEPVEPVAEAPFPKPLTSFIWLRRGESQAAEDESPVSLAHDDPEEHGWGILANVRIYEDRVQIDTLHRGNFEFAKTMVPKYFRSLLELKEETVVDLARIFRDDFNRAEQVEQETPSWQGVESARDESQLELPEAEINPPELSLPPLTDEQRKIVLDVHDKHYHRFLNDRVPWLDNHTPREAARDHALRPKLVDLMKFHINGLEQRSRVDGICYSIDWVLDELGLAELK